MTPSSKPPATAELLDACALRCGSCDACRFADAVRRAIDEAEASASSNDRATADRVAAMALASLQRAPAASVPRGARARATLVLLAAVVAASSAAALTYARWSAPRASSAAQPPSRSNAQISTPIASTRVPVEPATEAPVQARAEAPAEALPAEAPFVAPRREPSRREPESAEQLFAQANAARRMGAAGAARASALYRELQRSYPSSDQARQALLSEARWLLDARGDPRRALALVERYLQRNPSPTSVESALVARADAARALGSRAIERESWDELARRFPASLHAGRARERIAALRASPERGASQP